MAQMPSAVVRQCASTTMRPWSSSSTPAAAGSRPSVLARRPTATTRRSNSYSWAPLLSSQPTVTPVSWARAPVTRAPSRMSSPCRPNDLSASRATRWSAAGRKSSSASRTVTSAPSRAQTLPSSRPMTPAPMMPSRFGTSENARAPSLSTMRSPSTSATGIRTGTEPVARTMWRAVRVRRSPSPCGATATLPPPSRVASPAIDSTLFLRRSPATPRVSVRTTLSLRASMRPRSSLTSPASMPWAGSRWRTLW